MKAYWDSAALVETTLKPELWQRLKKERGFSRLHALAEIFSALTGKPHIKADADTAAQMIADIARNLDFVELTLADVLGALGDCKKAGVRGGSVHDFLHALAAKKSGATELLTLDQNDFNGLVPGLKITQV